MQKVLKIVWRIMEIQTIVALVMLVVSTIVYGTFKYVYHQRKQAFIKNRLWLADDRGFLCEWHYPAANGVPGYVEVCSHGGYFVTQCYRIEGDRVTDFHTEVDSSLERNISKVAALMRWRSDLNLPQHEKSLDLYYQTEKQFSHASREIEELVRPFKADGLGYVLVLSWKTPHIWAVAVYPLDKASPAVNELRDAFEIRMANPSGLEYHASYVRGYPVFSPEQPDNIPVLTAGKTPESFRSKQHDLLLFIPSMGRMLIPINKGIDPFKAFGVPFIPGNSVMLNYKSEENDGLWYLNGDNFWRVEVYAGEKKF